MIMDVLRGGGVEGRGVRLLKYMRGEYLDSREILGVPDSSLRQKLGVLGGLDC